MSENLPLLLTATINSNVYNNVGNIITDIQLRKEQYYTCLNKYITETDFNPIIFIENSDYNIDKKLFYDCAKLHSKQIEFISGSIMKKEIINYGKSFGDAFLIMEALSKSVLLNNEEFFYKVSGRIFLKNHRAICQTALKQRNEFIIYDSLKYCFTNFFKVNKNDYLTYFNKSYTLCNETNQKLIENVFYDIIKTSNITVSCFKVYPNFDGVMGATGGNYSGKKFERYLRNIAIKLGVFNYKSKWRFIISILYKVKTNIINH
ncbi:hypothetical protein [Beduini massiliensis]|uniref:hypothetical protein n=1 Tax=Beduini massiliensis TaxID=1585974 RepID=UPI00059AB155|nr:hypothetical protein [Beduini massiliensis]